MYHEQCDSLQDRQITLEEKQKGKSLLISTSPPSDLREEIKKVQAPITKQKEKHRDVSILINASTTGQVLLPMGTSHCPQLTLKLSYIVQNANWSPSYDIRVKTENYTTQLVYYGIIVNNTGDDWKEVDISLSTAQPAVGGNPPELSTLKVRLNTVYRESRKMSSGVHNNPMCINYTIATVAKGSDGREHRAHVVTMVAV